MYSKIFAIISFWKLSLLQVATILSILPACSAYDLTFNNKPILRAKSLFADYQIRDIHLSECIKQAIIDNKILLASQLIQLNCSHGNIISLNGLNVFMNLRKLNLSYNDIREILEIHSLYKLEVLHLANNHIVDPSPALRLSWLQELDLSYNPNLQCPDKNQLTKMRKAIFPSHCGQDIR